MDVEETRTEYVERFRDIAYEGLTELFGHGRFSLTGGHLEGFTIVQEGDTFSADTRFSYHGHRFRYKRQIWPPDFPLQIKTALYVEHLAEHLTLGHYQPSTDPEKRSDI